MHSSCHYPLSPSFLHSCIHRRSFTLHSLLLTSRLHFSTLHHTLTPSRSTGRPPSPPPLTTHSLAGVDRLTCFPSTPQLRNTPSSSLPFDLTSMVSPSLTLHPSQPSSLSVPLSQVPLTSPSTLTCRSVCAPPPHLAQLRCPAGITQQENVYTSPSASIPPSFPPSLPPPSCGLTPEEKVRSSW
ncbi:hypothetical protein E2C01_066288 [Portunus trituberculatus]|uniref:Uncharacterized protein n=1 Tax=Portunus trituberculatus TaxID=210409 RepID=A0A5B7HPV9_PORTR|nr:hypothetical protein [Portunus trituberculatus]